MSDKPHKGSTPLNTSRKSRSDKQPKGSKSAKGSKTLDCTQHHATDVVREDTPEGERLRRNNKRRRTNQQQVESLAQPAVSAAQNSDITPYVGNTAGLDPNTITQDVDINWYSSAVPTYVPTGSTETASPFREALTSGSNDENQHTSQPGNTSSMNTPSNPYRQEPLQTWTNPPAQRRRRDTVQSVTLPSPSRRVPTTVLVPNSIVHGQPLVPNPTFRGEPLVPNQIVRSEPLVRTQANTTHSTAHLMRIQTQRIPATVVTKYCQPFRNMKQQQRDEIEAFAARSPLERELASYHLQLDNRMRLDEILDAEKWELDGATKRDISKYCQNLILDPQRKHYEFDNDKLLKAYLHQCTFIPARVLECQKNKDKVESSLSYHVSQHKAQIKKKIVGGYTTDLHLAPLAQLTSQVFQLKGRILEDHKARTALLVEKSRR